MRFRIDYSSDLRAVRCALRPVLNDNYRLLPRPVRTGTRVNRLRRMQEGTGPITRLDGCVE